MASDVEIMNMQCLRHFFKSDEVDIQIAVLSVFINPLGLVNPHIVYGCSIFYKLSVCILINVCGLIRNLR